MKVFVSQTEKRDAVEAAPPKTKISFPNKKKTTQKNVHFFTYNENARRRIISRSSNTQFHNKNSQNNRKEFYIQEKKKKKKEEKWADIYTHTHARTDRAQKKQ